MFLRKQFDKRSGFYRSSDSIENFKIRVSLRALNTLIKVPKFHHFNSDVNDVNAPTEPKENDDNDEVESHTIRWQEKRLSQKEIKYFADRDNCQTDAQKEYHQTINRNGLDSDERNYDKIFTYVSEDSFDPHGDDKKFGEFIQRVDNLDEESLNGDLIISKADGKERFFKGIFGFETMYIMADLGVETILFTIRWRSQDGLLIVYPDFNSIVVNPYLQEIDSGTKHMFYYAIENVSENNDHDDDGMKKDIEVISHLTNLTITSPSLFHIPPKRCTNVLVFIEIESAECFEYDNIHIRYNITIPNRCELVDGLVQGSTHSCRKCSSQERYNIGYCHELMVLCSSDYQWEDNMKITLDVVSIDGWNRERSEGYTVISLPFKPGIFQHKLLCYRELTENTYMDRLRRYFIGGRRIVDHKTFNGLSATDKVSKLNRYGNETISSGVLFVKHQMVLQRNESLVKSSMARSRKANVKTSLKQKISIDDVVSAYQLAKHRLEATTSIK